MSDTAPSTPPPPAPHAEGGPAAKKPWWKRPWGIAVIALVALFVLAGIFGDSDAADDIAAPVVDDQVEDTEPVEDEPEVAEEPEPEPEPEPDPEPDPEPEPELTAGQRNALRAAENYLSFSPFSRSGLIDQLEFEDYSTEDATFAVDNVEVDWNEQAARSAENYLEFSPFSRGGLIEQLEFEGYTREQAEFGVDEAGL